MTVLGLETDETLLIGKIAFLVLLYLFILYVVRSATKGMNQAPQESIILGAAEGWKPPAARFIQAPGRRELWVGWLVLVGRTRLDEARFVGVHDGLHSIAQVELHEDMRDVGFDGCLADEERGGDLGVGEPAGDESQHFELARR